MTASRAAPAARHLSGWLLVGAALLILLASAVAIEVLHARYTASLHAELTLAQVRAEANQVSATDWEVATRHTRLAEVVAENRTAGGRLAAALAVLAPRQGDVPALKRVHTLAWAY